MSVAISPNGTTVRIGFNPVEDEYCFAAQTLLGKAREEAYEDISAITGRSVAVLKRRGAFLRAQDRQRAQAFLEVSLRKDWASGSSVMVPGCRYRDPSVFRRSPA